MSDQNIDIVITTQAKTEGAEKAQQSLKQIDDQAKRTGAAMKMPASGVDALDEEVAQLTERLLSAKVGTADFTEAQNKLLVALQRQFEAAQKLAPELDKTNNASQKVESTSRNTGLAVLEFSRAFEDAQYGIRGVLNNIPNLLGHLGVGAGIAGVASLAAVVLTKTLGPAFDALDEKLDLSGKASDERKEKAAALNEELGKATQRSEETNLNKYLEALDHVAKAHETVNERIQAEIEKQAELRVAREATLQSELQLQDALLRIGEGTGQITPEEAEKKRGILRKEMNEANLAASIAAVKEAEVKAKAQQEAAEYQLWRKKAEQAGVEQDLRRMENLYLKRLDELSQRRTEQLQARTSAQEEAASEIARRTNAAGGLLGPIGTIAAGATASMVVRPAETLKEDSAVAEAAAKLKALESSMLKLNQTIASQDNSISAAGDALSKAGENLKNVQEIVANKVESLQSIATNKEIIEKAEGLKDKLEKNAEESAKAIEKAIEGVEPQNAEEKAALGVLKKALEDGKVLPNEVQKVTQALNDLYGQLNGNFQQIAQQLQVNSQTQSGILRLLQTMQSQAQADRGKVEQLLRSQPK